MQVKSLIQKAAAAIAPATIADQIGRLEAQARIAAADVASATQALGEATLAADGQTPAAAVKTLRQAQERLDAIEAALTSARVRQAEQEAAEKAQAAAEAWQRADRLVAGLEDAGAELDRLLALAAIQHDRIVGICGELGRLAPVALENHVGAGRVRAVFPLSLERAGLPSQSRYRASFGELSTPPGAADFARSVRAYLDSRRPAAQPERAVA